MLDRTGNHRSRAVAAQMIELGFAVPEVMAYRIARMALAGSSPSARDRREFQRMGAEKVAAFYESWNAMLAEMLRVNVELALWSVGSFLAGWRTSRPLNQAAVTQIHRAAIGILGKGVAPIRSRAVANARRLRRAR
jgi:hypothetical protein